MREEDEVVISPLSCTIDRNGKHVQINIYRGTLAGDDWICEVIEGDESPSSPRSCHREPLLRADT